MSMAEQKQKFDSPAEWTPTFRLSFPSLVEPSAYQGKGEPVFSITMIFPKPDELAKLRTMAKAVAVQLFGPNLPANFWTPFRHCEEKADRNYKGYEPGYMYMKAKASKIITLGYAWRDKTPATAQDFYGGCYASAYVHFWPYQSGVNTGLSVRLNALQFVADGEKFAGRSVEFQDLGVEAGAFDGAEDQSDFL
jgi:hypothetical protein